MFGSYKVLINVESLNTQFSFNKNTYILKVKNDDFVDNESHRN